MQYVTIRNKHEKEVGMIYLIEDSGDILCRLNWQFDEKWYKCFDRDEASIYRDYTDNFFEIKKYNKEEYEEWLQSVYLLRELTS